ncbi:MAG: hypothetical protein JSS02_00480 [Planctomycetes bacterium]|nr:hypothetical protein [Planctomycetota bacterium]
MFFRFGVGLLLVVLTSLVGTALEKRTLELKRAVSGQHYRLERLKNMRASKRLQAQQLGAPNRLVENADALTGPEPAAAAPPPVVPTKRKSRNKPQR